MKAHAPQRSFVLRPLHVVVNTNPIGRRVAASPKTQISSSSYKCISRRVSTHRLCHVSISSRKCEDPSKNAKHSGEIVTKRRDFIITPFVAIGGAILRSAVARADDKSPDNAAATETPSPSPPTEEKVEEKIEEVINSRIYDATVIGEPMAVGKDNTKKVWEKLMNGRIIYLGEAEQVPTRDDKEVELEILKSLHKRCADSERQLSLALEAFPCDSQLQLNQFLDKSIDEESLKSIVTNWPNHRWEEYEPLLNYCRDNGVRLVACGIPLEVLRTIQAEGIKGLSAADRRLYSPPAGSGFISGFSAMSRRSSFDLNFVTQPSSTFEPSAYLSTQARAAEDYTMSQVILQAVNDAGATGMLVVVTGASHVTYGSRGTGLPARISKKMQKKNQVVILLDPERQHIRREGEVPVADFLWYSAARVCSRNCYDRAEIARVMNAAGRRRDALPQDLQKGLDLGVVSPEVLQNFFDLEKYPLISELTERFQGFRERLLADPKFLNRLAIEETISVTTTLIAQYERRKENFFEEIDYVITDTARGAVVDFFTVWLPAPTLSFLSFDEVNPTDKVEAFKGLLGSIPDNAFQKSLAGRDWDLNHRVASVVLGGVKLASVGFISSIGAVASSNMLYAIRKYLNPPLVSEKENKRSPILKTALVYGSFLGTSANLRYQFIAGIVEHRISDLLPDQTLFVNMLSVVVRIINSYFGTQQWIDLARYTGLQTRKTEPKPSPALESSNQTTLELESNDPTDTTKDEIANQ